MDIKKILLRVVSHGVNVFLATAVITALYGRIVYGACGLNWVLSAISGILGGILLTVLEFNVKKNKDRRNDKPSDDHTE